MSEKNVGGRKYSRAVAFVIAKCEARICCMHSVYNAREEARALSSAREMTGRNGVALPLAYYSAAFGVGNHVL